MHLSITSSFTLYNLKVDQLFFVKLNTSILIDFIFEKSMNKFLLKNSYKLILTVNFTGLFLINLQTLKLMVLCGSENLKQSLKERKILKIFQVKKIPLPQLVFSHLDT